jgi:hypothetical protein
LPAIYPNSEIAVRQTASTKNDALLNLMAMRNAPLRTMYFFAFANSIPLVRPAQRDARLLLVASQVMTEKSYGDQIFSKQTDFGIQPIKIGRDVYDG